VSLLLPIRGAIPAYYFCVSPGQASYIAPDALLLLVHLHPVWRKSRSTTRPITLFTSRCHDAYCATCVVSTFAICFHEPVFPATGYGGIKKATVWRVGRVLYAVSRCSARRGESSVDDQRDSTSNGKRRCIVISQSLPSRTPVYVYTV